MFRAVERCEQEKAGATSRPHTREGTDGEQEGNKHSLGVSWGRVAETRDGVV